VFDLKDRPFCSELFPELEEDVTQRLDAVGRAARERRAS
jgi:hypothetical protein